MTYTVRPIPSGTPQTTTRTTATFTGLTPGTSYTFAVTAANSAGTSAESTPSKAVTVLAAAPGAPVGLKITLDSGIGVLGTAKYIETAWSAPPLNGGELVRYEVREYDWKGRTDSSLYQETTRTTSSITAGSTCLAPYRVEVKTVTRTPGTQTEITGPAASVTTTATNDCTLAITIAAQPAAAGSATVTFTQTSGGHYFWWPCDLLFNGTAKWSGNCGSSNTPQAPATVTGLTPSTTYSVVLRISQRTTTTSNTATVTTPAG